ncbi:MULTISPECIES: thioredoxin family protein [Clostridia]|uniref:thioredoxin family protein n=1 Tax=Clostridia TaxID=186801 RepID=UPI000E9FFA6A|nr:MULTISPECIES: thioredoxin family protein [Clostridia]NBJ68058.1 thioredoxin [Roseburia sp. 1XD42-34]RKI82499.1 thioredoxin [Clostridium sp. 1xD42-85]
MTENHFTMLSNLDDIEAFIEQNELAFLYISREACSVCHGLFPQVEELMEKFPKIATAHITADQVEEIAGRFFVFTVPVLLLFVDGKEYLREARIVHMDLFHEKLDQIYSHVVGAK